MYDNKTFNSFAKHWKTGEPVPASMFDKIKQLEKYRAGTRLWHRCIVAGATGGGCFGHGSHDATLMLVGIWCSPCISMPGQVHLRCHICY